jgi:uncharacterized protein (DUF4415 family)
LTALTFQDVFIKGRSVASREAAQDWSRGQAKVAVTVRYDADIVDQFKAGGEGWQTRMNNALREWLKAHHA